MNRIVHVTDILGFGKVAEAISRMRELTPCSPKITRVKGQKWAIHRGVDGTWDQRLIGGGDPDPFEESRLTEL